MESWILYLSLPVAAYLILSGLDDLAVDLVWYWHAIYRPTVTPSAETLADTAEKHTAIFVPLWHEHQVIERMLAHNVATVQYSNYTVFVGVYPNDLPTLEAVSKAASRTQRAALPRAASGADL